MSKTAFPSKKKGLIPKKSVSEYTTEWKCSAIFSGSPSHALSLLPHFVIYSLIFTTLNTPELSKPKFYKRPCQQLCCVLHKAEAQA